MTPLRHTPLHALHKGLGARMVPFAGFEMPLQYSSILREHRVVREAAGLFDVSHMGQIHLRGPAAVEAAECLVTCPVRTLRPGRVRYGLLCNEAGGIVDDVTVYRLTEQDLFFCVNAANVEKDRDWIRGHVPPETTVHDASAETGLLALQGPRSSEVLAELAEPAIGALRRFHFAHGTVAGRDALVSRTGYTGCDGFEIYLAVADTTCVFEALLARGAGRGLEPAGLGARDTLRLEAALPLYGHELDETTSPLEARLNRFVKLEAGGFIGAKAIAERAAAGFERLLVGFELLERGVARAGQEIDCAPGSSGIVTSGGPSPTLGKSIGLGYVPPASAGLGSRFEVRVRGRGIPAQVVETPFVGKQASVKA